MPKHNGGFYEKGKWQGRTWFSLWSDYQDYKDCDAPEKLVWSKTDGKCPAEGRDLVDALQAGELDNIFVREPGL